MKNIFESIYEREQSIKAAYHAAKDEGNEQGMEQARADHAALSEEVSAKGPAFIRIARDYMTSREKGNATIDFRDVIWDKDVKGLIDCLRENGIETFTFSSGWSSAVETAWLFQENGCKLEGLIRVYGDRAGFGEDGYELAPAYLFRV